MTSHGEETMMMMYGGGFESSSPVTTGQVMRSYKRDTSALDQEEAAAGEVVVGKRFKTGELHACELCQSTFASQAHLKQHVDTFHMAKSMWQCSECKKLFSSKSNLKVHLRVHTRIKPYHCKSCSYSCMHHSSIKEHLAKIHPDIVHTATSPGYAFNSVVVPDPDQFNSSQFNREAFIAEAKVSNEKLIAQMTTIYNRKEPGTGKSKRQLNVNNSITVSPISTSSSSSSSSSHKNEGDEDNSFEHNDSANNTNTSSSSSASASSPLLQLSNQGAKRPAVAGQTPKSLNFSISSLMDNKSPTAAGVQPSESMDRNWSSQAALGALASSMFQKMPISSLYSNSGIGYLPTTAAGSQAWSYANQIQFFYNYLAQMCQANQASK